MPENAIATEFIGSTLVVRFNRPAQRNPLSTTTLLELRNSLSLSASRNNIRSIIITSTDDIFASGANIRELTELDQDSAREFSRLGQQLFQSIADARQTVIAAINGYCIGGALDLALACDIRLAAPHAQFAHPGARLGIITGWGGTQKLPRIIGKAAALEMFTTARYLSAARALELGLVSEIAEPVFDRALELARGMVGKSN